MKKLFTFIAGIALIYSTSGTLNAQSFTMQYSTVTDTPIGFKNLPDNITPSLGSVQVEWKVIESNFPADWIGPTGICDNTLCHPMSALWTSAAMQTSGTYSAPNGDFHMQINLDAATTLGCYYVKVRLNDKASPGDTAIVTFNVCKIHPTATPNVIRFSNDVVLYPNPATDEVNVIFDANADVRNIAVYNIIGKMMAVYKVNGNSANVGLENMPSGIYFVRLVNSQGNIVATKKFTKQ